MAVPGERYRPTLPGPQLSSLQGTMRNIPGLRTPDLVPTAEVCMGHWQ